tara:strand:- start:2039 stop:2725 length:687 start_codon:yes stop_codon:yes gene_type:complete
LIKEYVNKDQLPKDIFLTTVIYILCRGKVGKKVHSEDIAKQAHKYRKNDFSWISDKDVPDLDRLYRSLTKAKANNWIYGSVSRKDEQTYKEKDGWFLQPNGCVIAERYHSLFEKSEDVKYYHTDIKIQLAPIISNVKSSQIYKNFVQNNIFEINEYELSKMLGVSPNNERRLNQKFNLLVQAAEVSEDKKLEELTMKIQNRFPKILNTETLLKAYSKIGRSKKKIKGL